MPDPTTTITDTVEDVDLLPLIDRSALTGSFAEAVQAHVAATEPVEIGDHGVLVRQPVGWDTVPFDVRDFLDLPDHVIHRQDLVGVASFATYVATHAQPPDTRLYAHDPYGTGPNMLRRDTEFITAVIDDHHAGNYPNHRDHEASMVLRPTAAARRWATALGGTLRQDQFLELVVDGITEIANPDGAVLRDLVKDLHAIRSVEVSSVIRTGGSGSIELADNVTLSAGTGNKVPFPEQMSVVFVPFAGIDRIISMTVKITPKVDKQSHEVTFTLTAADIEDQLASALSHVCDEVADATGIRPLWVP